MYYATTHEFDGLAVHVFADRGDRDAWANAVGVGDDGYVSGYDVYSFEGGPREAITARETRRLFSEGHWPAVDTVTTHAGVRPRGIRRRQGYALLPKWMDSELDRFSVGPRCGFGHPDYTSDVLYQRNS